MYERNINWVPLICALAGDQTHNAGMYPDQESNWRSFGVRDDAQPTEPHRSGIFPFVIVFFPLPFIPPKERELFFKNIPLPELRLGKIIISRYTRRCLLTPSSMEYRVNKM